MLKKIFTILVFSTIILCGCSKKQDKNLYASIIEKDNLIVGISIDAKPFGFKDSDGKIKGLEADLAREITKRLLGSPNKVIFKDIPQQDRLKAASSGDVDMVISTITITPQRKRLVAFSEPYFIAGQVICVRKDSKINSHYDLLNKKVIVIIGTTGEKNIKKFAPNALIQAYNDNFYALSEFKNGAADAISTDDSLLQGFVLENGDYMILPEKLTNEPYGIAFKKANGSREFKDTVDKIINEIKYDGTLDNIKEKWGIN